MRRLLWPLVFCSLFLISASYYPSDDLVVFRGGARLPKLGGGGERCVEVDNLGVLGVHTEGCGVVGSSLWDDAGDYLEPTGGEAVRAALQDKGGQVYNAKAYGSIGDGVTDDTAAIKAMLDAATNRRGSFYFPDGDYLFDESLHWTRVASPDGKGEGIVIRGAGVQNTVLNYQGSDWALVFNDGTGTGDLAYCVIEHLTISIGSASAGAVLFGDATNHCQLRDVLIVGYAKTSGVGIQMVGERSCNCHNIFDGVIIRKILTGVKLSGFANANRFSSVACATAGTCFDFSKVSANQVCSSNGEPFACCTGAGAGSGADYCAADTRAGSQNLLERTEVDGGAALGINLADNADGNILLKVVTDGSTASLTAVDGIDGLTVIGSSLSPAPSLTGSALTSTLWLGTHPTTGLVNTQVLGLGTTLLTDSATSRTLQVSNKDSSLDYMKLNVAGTGYASGTPAIWATDFDGASDDIKVILTPRGGANDAMVGTLSNHPFYINVNDNGAIGIDTSLNVDIMSNNLRMLDNHAVLMKEDVASGGNYVGIRAADTLGGDAIVVFGDDIRSCAADEILSVSSVVPGTPPVITLACITNYIHPNSADPPAACSGMKGHMYTDTDINLPCFCDGTNWVRMSDFSTHCTTTTTTTTTTSTTTTTTL